jgi:AcrR family transcriptional regulator
MSCAGVELGAALGPPVEGANLAAGVGGSPRERTEEVQRERVLHALLELAAERRYQGATITDLIARAGVSRDTFLRLFGDLQTCFLELLGRVTARSAAVVSEAFEREASWPEGVLAGLAALLALLDSEPLLARVCLLEGLAAGAPGVERRGRELAVLQPLLEAGTAHAPAGRQPSALTAEATIGSIESLLRTRLVSGHAPPFIGLLGSLGEIALAPYLDAPSLAQVLGRVEAIGRDAAARRLAEPSPWRTADVPRVLLAPTAHRARAVVRYLAEHPGASNRRIAAGVGIPHIGQISELLARLDRAGLLDKHAGRAGRPNAWTLSPHGARAVQALGEGW